jgi:hypothetical protein
VFHLVLSFVVPIRLQVHAKLTESFPNLVGIVLLGEGSILCSDSHVKRLELALNVLVLRLLLWFDFSVDTVLDESFLNCQVYRVRRNPFF